MDKETFLNRVAQLVDSPEYWNQLHDIIKDLQPLQKWKCLMDLAEFVTPKVKTVDPTVAEQDTSVTINYV